MLFRQHLIFYYLLWISDFPYKNWKHKMILSVLKKSRIVHLCFAISFFTSGLIINIAQFILYTCLKPFNKRLYRKLGYYLCYTFYSRKYYQHNYLSPFGIWDGFLDWSVAPIEQTLNDNLVFNMWTNIFICMLINLISQQVIFIFIAKFIIITLSQICMMFFNL